ncbi:uroporphyrinogen-III C-methyltransferase [Telluria mixta]|uniref:Uroporphyrinogen-III C-methyltransferase n=1 Tax=Telluria mixta TaxID=34071 RepID=A0ABT2CA34_9BURK|nr:uroporphyrinogen-III C-methyltransferase [Telluria mixta]MCS0633544.1 uroporphyrinogen-III C-methyltransferase [Telluria mixta]WEM95991.1 uroporphyrinogen-III C-methyltransferase [Telluria mixta]
MNELPNNPEKPNMGGPVVPPESYVTPAPAGPGEPRVPEGTRVGGLLQKPQNVAILALAVLLALQTWSTHSRFNKLREDVARTLQKDNASNAETAQAVREIRETAKDLQVKVGVLENRQTEAQSQQAALEQMYQDISKNRDEWALSEIEQVLSTASQQLQLAGNVQGALIALQNADRSLSRSDKPQFITIRRAIARDIEKLKALPSVDQPGIALRLDNVISQIDNLPLLSDEKPAEPIAPSRVNSTPVAGKTAAPADRTLGQRMLETWRNWSHEMWDDIRQLIRVRTVDNPDALMLSPSESYFVRENLKLRLLNARLALLSRNEGTFRDDLNTAQQQLVKYFDTKARSTQAAQALLRQVQANNVTIDVPDLSESLNAVRNYKSKP